MREPTDRDVVSELRRWQESGALWRVVSRSRSGATIALCTCDGGEEVSRITSSDPRLIEFLGDRLSSED